MSIFCLFETKIVRRSPQPRILTVSKAIRQALLMKYTGNLIYGGDPNILELLHLMQQVTPKPKRTIRYYPAEHQGITSLKVTGGHRQQKSRHETLRYPNWATDNNKRQPTEPKAHMECTYFQGPAAHDNGLHALCSASRQWISFEVFWHLQYLISFIYDSKPSSHGMEETLCWCLSPLATLAISSTIQVLFKY